MAAPSITTNASEPVKPTDRDQPEEDIVTRIQTNLDQLATQFYASVRYLSTHHPLLDFDGTPLNELTGLPLRPTAQQAQAATSVATPGATAENEGTGPEKKSKKDKKEKAAKDDGEGGEPAAKPPLSPEWTPMDTDPFVLDISELAGDLITKQKQIEELLNQLPRQLELQEHEQERRIRELIQQLDDLEANVDSARRERDLLLSRVEGVIESVGRRGGG